MIFLSTRGSKPRTGLDAFLYPTAANADGLYFPANIPEIKITIKQSDEEIFINLFHTFCQDFLSKDELSSIYKAFTPQFKDGKIYKIRETAQGKFLELTNGKSLSMDDAPFTIIKEMLKVVAKRENKKIKIINIGNINSHLSILETFGGDQDFKICSIFANQDFTNFVNYKLLDSKNNIVTAKVKMDKFKTIQDSIYRHSYLNSYYNFTAIGDHNFFYILSLVYVLMLVCKELEGNLFSLAIPSQNMSFATAIVIAKKLGIEIKNCNLVFYKNSFLKNILNDGKMIKESQRNTDKWFESYRICEYPLNFERILFLSYDFDSSSLSRAMTSFEEYGNYTINKTVIGKISQVFETTIVENSFDVLNQIGNFARNYTIYMEQNTALASIAGDALKTHLRANEIMLNLSTVHYETSQELMQDVLGFQLKSDKIWNQIDKKFEPIQVTEIPDDITEVARFIANSLK